MARRMASISVARSPQPPVCFPARPGRCESCRAHPGSAARFQHRHALSDVRRGALGLREAVLLEVVGMLVGAVGELVSDRLGVGPQPGDRPEQPAEGERQQAERPDRLELRVVPLVRDLLGQNVHQPEQHDQQDRHEEQDEDGDIARHRVLDFGGHQRRMGGRRNGQGPHGSEQADESGPRGMMRPRHGIESRRVRHKDLCFDLSTPRATGTCERNEANDAGRQQVDRYRQPKDRDRIERSSPAVRVPSVNPGHAIPGSRSDITVGRQDAHRIPSAFQGRARAL